MRYFTTLSLLVVTFVLSGCNTIGGLGQDLSETGKALDNAAYWSQNQIQDLNEDSSSNTDTATDLNASTMNYNNSQIVVEEPDTLRQY
jgi:predicted small secreted protein